MVCKMYICVQFNVYPYVTAYYKPFGEDEINIRNCGGHTIRYKWN